MSRILGLERVDLNGTILGGDGFRLTSLTISRFANDMKVIDLFVCDSIASWFLEAFRLLAVAAILCYNVPSFVVAIMTFGAVYFIVKVGPQREMSSLRMERTNTLLNDYN